MRQAGYRIIGWCLVLWLGIAGCTTRYHYKTSGVKPHPYPAPRLVHSEIRRYLNAVNRIRAEGRRCGHAGYFPAVAPLRWSDALYRAAYEHSRDMQHTNRLSHQGSHSGSDRTARVQRLGHGSSFRERIENNGYTRFRLIAENIAYGEPTVDAVMQLWIHSEGHCENIMNPDLTHFGMAHSPKQHSRDRLYWTQDFAAHQ